MHLDESGKRTPSLVTRALRALTTALGGPSRNEAVLGELAARQGGELKADHGVFSSPRADVVTLKYGESCLEIRTGTIAVRHSVNRFTDIAVSSPYFGDLSFSLRPQNLVRSAVDRLAGRVDLFEGEESFGRQFIVTAAEPGRVRKLLSDPQLQSRLLQFPLVSAELSAPEGAPGGPSVLRIHYPRECENIETLEALVDLGRLFTDRIRELAG